MNKCKNCSVLTSNPKYCSRSCAVTKNNTLFPKVKALSDKEAKCRVCDKLLLGLKGRKFCSHKCHRISLRDSLYADIINNQGLHDSRTLRLFLIQKKGHKCERCLNTHWLTSLIPLELEHKDGNSTNNKLENIELLCPNCHALTATYKGRNKGNGRYSRRVKYAAGLSY